ncbi:hypothetical protein STEG23_016474 [Scotinomys teguina]
MARKAGQGKEEEESRAKEQEEKTPVRDEEKKPACHGGGHHVVEQVATWPIACGSTLFHYMVSSSMAGWLLPPPGLVFSSCCLALDSSSSFPCPAFLGHRQINIRTATAACLLGTFEWKIFFQPFTLSF